MSNPSYKVRVVVEFMGQTAGLRQQVSLYRDILLPFVPFTGLVLRLDNVVKIPSVVQVLWRHHEGYFRVATSDDAYTASRRCPLTTEAQKEMENAGWRVAKIGERPQWSPSDPLLQGANPHG